MTFWTCPFSDSEVFELAVFVSADMAKLAGCVENICPVDGSPVSVCLLAKHVYKS